MNTDYKTTITFFIVIIAFIYSVYVQNTGLVSIITFPLVSMWIILKTNSKELIQGLLEAYNKKERR